MADKPRLLLNSRDLSLTIVTLLALCAVAAFASGNVHWGFGPKIDTAHVPTVDAKAILQVAADEVSFPVRQPAGPDVVNAVPSGWIANSTSQPNVAGGQAVINVGYVTSDRQYLQLSQSDGSASDIVESVFGARQTQSGTVPVGDRTWQVYGPASDGRNAWLLPLDGVTIALYGSATVPSFERLAAAAQDQPPLARQKQ